MNKLFVSFLLLSFFSSVQAQPYGPGPTFSLTAPYSVAGQDGSPQFSFDYSFGAVNHPAEKSSTTGQSPWIGCDGTDANVNCDILTKGTGSVFSANGSGVLNAHIDPGGVGGDFVCDQPGTGASASTANILICHLIGTVISQDSAGSLDLPANTLVNGQPIGSGSSASSILANSDWTFDNYNGFQNTVSSVGAYCADRWIRSGNGTGGFTCTDQVTLLPPAPVGNAERIAISSAYSNTANEFQDIENQISVKESANLQWGSSHAQSVVLDYWIYLGSSSCAVPFVLPVSINNNEGGSNFASYVSEATLPGVTIWYHIQQVIPGPTSGIWAPGVFLSVGLGAGSNFLAPANATWYYGTTSPYRATSASSQAIAQLGCIVYITGLHLRMGNIANMGYTPPAYATEYNRVASYMQTSFPVGVTPVQAYGINKTEFTFPATASGTGTNTSQFKQFSQPLLGNPVTERAYNPVNSNADCYDETISADAGTATITANTRGFTVSCPGASGTAIGDKLGINWLVSM